MLCHTVGSLPHTAIYPCRRCDAIESALRAAEARGLREAAAMHESIDSECDRDRLETGRNRRCGCGAMGAIIEFRDMIRERAAEREKGGR